MLASHHAWRSITCCLAVALLVPYSVRAQAQSAPALSKNTPSAAPSSSRNMLPPGSRESDWLLPGHDYAARRFSELNKIDTSNVSKLKEVWSYTTGIADGHEGQPLVVGGRMYVVTPYPNRLIAFDLAKPGPAKLWEYSPPINQVAFGKACCDDVNRGASYYNGTIIYNVLDNQTVAVNAQTGKEVWRTKLADPNQGSTMTMAPLVAKGKVYVGNSGGEMGVRGWLTALDARDVVFYGTMDGDFKAVNATSGKELWKTHFKSGIVGNAITYLGPDGKQYIAVYEGVGGWAGAIVPGHLSPDDPYAALGAVNAMKDLPEHTQPGGALHVFALQQ